MKTNRLLTVLSLIAIFVLCACTVQKRIHRGGYHIEFKKRYKADQPQVAPDHLTHASVKDDVSNSVVALQTHQSKNETKTFELTTSIDNQEPTLVEPNTDFASVENELSIEIAERKALIPTVDDSLPKTRYKTSLSLHGSAQNEWFCHCWICLFYCGHICPYFIICHFRNSFLWSCAEPNWKKPRDNERTRIGYCWPSYKYSLYTHSSRHSVLIVCVLLKMK